MSFETHLNTKKPLIAESFIPSQLINRWLSTGKGAEEFDESILNTGESYLISPIMGSTFHESDSVSESSFKFNAQELSSTLMYDGAGSSCTNDSNNQEYEKELRREPFALIATVNELKLAG